MLSSSSSLFGFFVLSFRESDLMILIFRSFAFNRSCFHLLLLFRNAVTKVNYVRLDVRRTCMCVCECFFVCFFAFRHRLCSRAFLCERSTCLRSNSLDVNANDVQSFFLSFPFFEIFRVDVFVCCFSISADSSLNCCIYWIAIRSAAQKKIEDKHTPILFVCEWRIRRKEKTNRRKMFTCEFLQISDVTWCIKMTR